MKRLRKDLLSLWVKQPFLMLMVIGFLEGIHPFFRWPHDIDIYEYQRAGRCPQITLLQGLIWLHSPYLILFQLPRNDDQKRKNTWEAMVSVCSDWNVCATNANGISGGLGVMWNASKISLKAYHYDAGIILTGYLAGSIQRIRIINSYAPYNDTKS